MNANHPTRFARRALFGAGGFVALLLAGMRPRGAHAETAAPIPQPDRPGPPAFIKRAFAMRDRAARSGDQAYGAVMVKDGRIVAQSPSRVILDRDPTAHAEMAAIHDAARRLGRRDLSGCTLYSSSRPCPMCEAAAYWAGIDGLVHGRGITDTGAPRLCG